MWQKTYQHITVGDRVTEYFLLQDVRTGGPDAPAPTSAPEERACFLQALMLYGLVSLGKQCIQVRIGAYISQQHDLLSRGEIGGHGLPPAGVPLANFWRDQNFNKLSGAAGRMEWDNICHNGRCASLHCGCWPVRAAGLFVQVTFGWLMKT